MTTHAKPAPSPPANWPSGSPAIAPSSISTRRSRSCRCCRGNSAPAPPKSPPSSRCQHAGGGADRALHRRDRRRARPQARDRRRDVRAGDPDGDGRPVDSLSALIFWRAVQGLVLPPIFAVTVAYIGDEWPPREATTAAGIYSSGSSIGGFTGRLYHRPARRPDRLARRLLRARRHRLCRRDRGRGSPAA